MVVRGPLGPLNARALPVENRSTLPYPKMALPYRLVGVQDEKPDTTAARPHSLL